MSSSNPKSRRRRISFHLSHLLVLMGFVAVILVAIRYYNDVQRERDAAILALNPLGVSFYSDGPSRALDVSRRNQEHAPVEAFALLTKIPAYQELTFMDGPPLSVEEAAAFVPRRPFQSLWLLGTWFSPKAIQFLESRSVSFESLETTSVDSDHVLHWASRVNGLKSIDLELIPNKAIRMTSGFLSLRELKLQFRPFSDIGDHVDAGTYVITISGLRDLRSLDLVELGESSSAIITLQRNPELVDLRIDAHRVSDSSLTLEACPRIHRLSLIGWAATEDLWSSIADLGQLRHLDLDGMFGPDAAQGIFPASLRSLTMQDCWFSPGTIERLSRLEHLGELTFNNCDVSTGNEESGFRESSIRLTGGFQSLRKLSIACYDPFVDASNSVITVSGLRQLRTVNLKLEDFKAWESPERIIALQRNMELDDVTIDCGHALVGTVLALEACPKVHRLSLVGVTWTRELWSSIASCAQLDQLVLADMKERRGVPARFPASLRSVTARNCFFSTATIDQLRTSRHIRNATLSGCYENSIDNPLPLDWNKADAGRVGRTTSSR